MGKFQADATTIVGLAVFVGITVALVLGKIHIDAWLAVSSSCIVLVGVKQTMAPMQQNNAKNQIVLPPEQEEKK
ncbi:MAG: hypothetical protein ACRYGR_09400 [Janthinobacterium lividum]